MMRVLWLSLMLAVSGCATHQPNYVDAQVSAFTEANHRATEQLLERLQMPLEAGLPLLVATLVNIDSLTQSSRFGRLVSEQVATRLTQLGHHVVEMKLRQSVYIREGTGELLLSRDVRDLSRNYRAQVVVVGNYAVAAGYIYLTLKAVQVTDNRVLSAVNYMLPLSDNNKALLAETTSRP